MKESRPYRVVLIDDEEDELSRINSYLNDYPALGRWIETVTPVLAKPDVESACRFLIEHVAETDIVLADLFMPTFPGAEPLPAGGYRLIDALAAIDADERPQLVVISGKPGAERAINEYRAKYRSWFRYLQKPASPGAVYMRFQDVDNWRYALEWAVADLSAKRRKSPASGADFEAPVKSEKMEECQDLIKKAARSEIPVLLLGESGVGKSFFARTIHSLSSRSDKPIKECNCAAIPGTLAESELFGHEAGAFPGATQRRNGIFELADKGTLFLDEVGELSLETQAKLLRVLQDGQFERLGGTETLRANGRLICATLRSLDDMVQQRKFREDLLHRIDVFPIYIPPLRERREEILPLAHKFLSRYDSLSRIQGFSAEAVLALTSYDWPDNIRGLDNMIRRALALCDGDFIEAKHLTVPMLNSWPGQKPVMQESSVSGLITPKALSRDDIVSVLRRSEDAGSPGFFRYDEAAEIIGSSPTLIKRLVREWNLQTEFPPAAPRQASI